jgi:Tol biopolymer transport system component
MDLQGGIRAPVVTTRGYSGAPVWSPDGAQLAFAYQPPGQMDDVYVKDFRTGQVTPIIQSPAVWEHPAAWSRDGRHLLVGAVRDMQNPQGELLVWSFASRTLTPLATKNVSVLAAAFSPDDRYLAFTSTESGRQETCVTTFPEGVQTWSLTTEGGMPLSWRADGREILVATLSGHIAAYPVTTTDGGFSAGQPTILVRDVGVGALFTSVTPDHSRILIRVSPDAAKDKGEIRLLFGWQEALKGRAR